jgi:hypothetical protein
MRTCAPEPAVVHAVPGRVRLHLPAHSWEAWSQVELTLRQTRGVRSARANPRTGNVLVYYDPRATNPAALAAALRGGAAPPAPPPRPSPVPGQPRRPFRSAARRLAPLVRAAHRRPAPGLVSVAELSLALGRSVLAGRRSQTPSLLASAADLPLVRRLLERLLGRPLAELARHLTAIVTSALAGQVIDLLVACLKGLRWVFGVLSPDPASA